MEGRNHADAIIGRPRGTRDEIVVRREQYGIRVVFARTRDFDKDVGPFKVYTGPRAGTVDDSGIEVIDDVDVRADGFDS